MLRVVVVVVVVGGWLFGACAGQSSGQACVLAFINIAAYSDVLELPLHRIFMGICFIFLTLFQLQYCMRVMNLQIA